MAWPEEWDGTGSVQDVSASEGSDPAGGALRQGSRSQGGGVWVAASTAPALVVTMLQVLLCILMAHCHNQMGKLRHKSI